MIHCVTITYSDGSMWAVVVAGAIDQQDAMVRVKRKLWDYAVKPISYIMPSSQEEANGAIFRYFSELVG